jgi:tetratricopeptide (TPR) repeat protein
MGTEATPGGNSPAASRRRARLLAVALLVLGGAAYYVSTRWKEATSPVIPTTLPDDDAELPPVVVRNPGYVGVSACAPCHQKRVNDFLGTRHMVAGVPPRPETMPAAFTPSGTTHQSHVPGVRFEMSRRGSDFLMTCVRSAPQGEQRQTSPIGLVYGAGGVLDEVYFTWRGDELYELPVSYLHPQKCWANVTFTRHAAGDFSRFTTVRCVECHMTWFEHLPGTANRYKPESFIHGIGCERCHGPGQEHVSHHQAHPDSPAAAVVHPGRLSRDQRTDICAQCHSNVFKPRAPAFSYRPGEPLEEYLRTGISRHREDDHVANQTKYMQESKCFQKSDSLTCVTCHNPHKPTDHEATRHACAKCHKPEDCREQPRLPAAVRGDCTGCHMPPRVWVNVHFHTTDDLYLPPIRRFEHRTGVYPEATQAVLLEWHRAQPDAASKAEAERLANALSERWLAEADRRAAGHRYLAAIGAVREALRAKDVPATREKLKTLQTTLLGIQNDTAEGMALTDRGELPEAVRKFERVLAVDPDNAVAHGRLGKVLAMTGNTGGAAEHLRAVARCDPNDGYGENLLGRLAFQAGRPAEAVEAFRRAEEMEPFSADLRYRWALALLQLERWAEAEERFRAALAADPNHAGAHQGLSHALRKQGKVAEAVRHARRAVRLTNEENPDVLVTLGDAYSDAGRPLDAVLAYQKAGEAMRAGDPPVREMNDKLNDARRRAGLPPR